MIPDLNIKDETAKLKSVVLGTAKSFGGTPSLKAAYDPKSREHIRKGTFPHIVDIRREMEGFKKILESHGVNVFRPKTIKDLNQVYPRDIGFVIDNWFVKSHVLNQRLQEIEGIEFIINKMDKSHVIEPPPEVRIEGGDVMIWKGNLFVGYSEDKDFRKYEVARTNREGVEYLRSTFMDYEIHAFELCKSDDDPMENALHLDCCFQPIGQNKAIIFKEGFKSISDYNFLMDFFGKENVVEIDRLEMYDMCSNIFSITPEIIVSEQNFRRLNAALRNLGFTVEEIPYAETAKMEGLLRCSTLPLERE